MAGVHVLHRATDPVGAHVARALLSAGARTIFLEPRPAIEAALEEAAWACCEPVIPSLLAGAEWSGGRGGVYWCLEDHDPFSEASRRTHRSSVSSALSEAAQIGCSRFVYLSSAYLDGEPREPAGEQAAGEVEEDVASFCGQRALAFTILRPSIVAGPFSTLRTARPTAALAAFTSWLARLDLGERRTVNLIPVDRLVQDVQRISSAGFEAKVFHLTSGEDLRLEIVAGQRGAEVVTLGPDGAGAAVGLQPSVFKRRLAPHAPLFMNAAHAYLQSSMLEARGTSVRHIFRPATAEGADGHGLLTYTCGDEARPTVVLVNAFGMPAEFLAPLACELARAFHVFTWESRGVPNLPAPFDPERAGPFVHVEDLRALLGSRRDPVHVAGWCNGAQVALQFALAWPERVGRLLLLNGGFALDSTCPATPYEKFLAGLMKAAAKSRASAKTLSDITVRKEAMGDQGGADLARSAYLQHLAKLPYRSGESFFRYGVTLRQFAEARLARYAPSPRTEVLLMTGGLDAVVHPEESRFVASQIPGAALLHVEDADHTALYDHQRMASAIGGFLRGSPL